MLIVPAIDIIGGKCVRLSQGLYSKKKVYSDNPLSIALNFQSQGAEILNIIDLDGAFSGRPVNFAKISEIVRSLDIPVQVGGGVRSEDDLDRYFEVGVRRVILGTKALNDFAFLKRVLEKFGSDKIIVGVDVKDGKAAVNGWTETIAVDYVEFAKQMVGIGVEFVLSTDVECDGMLKTPDISIFKNLTSLGLKVFAGGGISSIESLKSLQNSFIYGAVLGKSLYENKLFLKDILKNISKKSFLAKRIIPCMDVKNGRVVKGVNFVDLADVGDPVALGMKYSNEGADELVFLDISASNEGRSILFDMVANISENVFIPFTVGGGIRSVSDIRNVLKNGADKVSINTSAVKNPDLISRAAEIFGSQCIVVAIDVKKIGDGYKVFINGGREEASLEVLDWAKEVETRGAGEILLTSIDQDGTKTGLDNVLLKKVSNAVNIPVIASGGVGSLDDFKDGFLEGGADAVLAAGIFHRGEYSISDVKKFLNLKI